MKTKSGLASKQILPAMAVVGMLLILAAITKPQYSCGDMGMIRATSQLCTDLQTVRSQIGSYRIQHDDELPGTTEGVSFIEALTLKTNADGSIAKEGRFGPYLQQFPVNGFNGLDTVEIDECPGGGNYGCPGGTDYGWHYNTTTGGFHAGDDAHVGL